MAEKQLAYDTRGKDDLFADDDPLAELARIVGFEPRVAANTVNEAARREPALDLEDELVREFDRYDAPRPLGELDRPAEPVAEGIDPEDYVEPVLDAAPVLESAEAPEPVSVAPAPVEEAAASAARGWDEQAADWAAGPQQLSVDPDFEAPVQSAFGGARDLIEELELSIGAAPVSAVPQPAKAPQWSAASIRLPLANFHAAKREEPVVQPEPVAEPEIESVAEASFADLSEVEPQPAIQQPAPVAAVEPSEEFESAAPSLGFPAELDRHDDALVAPEETAQVEEFVEIQDDQDFDADAGFDLAAAIEGEIQADAALTEVVPDVPHTAGTFDLDDLLADVSRYPVPNPVLKRANPVAVAPQPAAPIETAPVAAAPVQPDPIAPVPVEPAPTYAVEAARPVAPQLAEAAPQQPAAAAYSRAPQPLPEADDPFAGHDFELDLAGIELELADLDFSEPGEAEPQPEPQAPVMAPQPRAVAPAPQQAAPLPQPVTRPQAVVAPAQPAPVVTSEPPAPAQAPAFNWTPVADSTEDLPFDPAMISDPEERPETVDDMHVPALPPVEQPAPVAKTADFDFDLDAEIASFFEPAKPRETPAPVRDTAAAAAKPVKPTIADGLDDFERALEEDFRRSVREPVERRENVSEVRIESASQAADFSRARSMRRLLAGAVVLVVFAGVGYGVYSSVWNGEGLGIVASGEPRVIVADKEPVKVVPENPGGKTVPNQDKAVYDRVAGSAEEPKQKALVSSDEAPVDVVQRTLTPEALPEDDENAGANDQITPTAVGETEDPRLLPSQDSADSSAASDGDKAPSVSPRKVRTMIVKPDGTLVAREDLAPADQPAQAAPATPSAQATSPALAPQSTPAVPPVGGSAASFPASAEVASADARSAAPVETAPAQPSPAATIDTPAADSASADAPVRPVKTTPVTDTAPVPMARPAEQPVNIVGTVTEKGNIRQPAQQAKTTQVAAASPAAAQPQQTASAGGYGIQIASLPSEDEANKSYASLSKKFAGVLGGRAHEIRRADIAGKGTFYRVRIPAGSKDEAAALCEQYRAAGGSCLISK
ncbi:sporulation protein [Rhizobium sp. R634]|uniref:SPOR domain-containing protein n=1 Tax=Rhizobium sp. R634 TaxID=1764274 RepID=UPI000B531F9B|nr:SPOR domain-containing protein [Rhizobium sp. R634]OWV79593.1 sporulation protein [Rhizobium sp. R634]